MSRSGAVHDHQFELETLEPGIMLSGDGVPVPVASNAVTTEVVNVDDDLLKPSNDFDLSLKSSASSSLDEITENQASKIEIAESSVSESAKASGFSDFKSLSVDENAPPPTGLKISNEDRILPLDLSSEDLTVGSLETLSGIGVIKGNVTNLGVLSPGNSPGEITVNGDLNLDINDTDTANSGDGYSPDGSDTVGTLEIELGGTSAGTQYDHLNTTCALSYVLRF